MGMHPPNVRAPKSNVWLLDDHKWTQDPWRCDDNGQVQHGLFVRFASTLILLKIVVPYVTVFFVITEWWLYQTSDIIYCDEVH